jgi:hypothetical protein
MRSQNATKQMRCLPLDVCHFIDDHQLQPQLPASSVPLPPEPTAAIETRRSTGTPAIAASTS